MTTFPPQFPPPQMPPPIPPKAKKKRWPWITAATVFGLFILFAIIGNLDKHPTTTRTAATSTTSTTPPTTTSTAARTTTTAAPSTTSASPIAAPPPPPPAPVIAPPQAAPDTLTPQQQADIVYIAVLDENHVHYASPEAAIDVGHKICTARAAGNTETAIGLAILNTGQYSAADAGTIVGAAESAYCPEYK